MNSSGKCSSHDYRILRTGIMGLIFAYGYAKSKSIYIPTATIHLGWGIVPDNWFSPVPSGQSNFIEALPRPVCYRFLLRYFFMEFSGGECLRCELLVDLEPGRNKTGGQFYTCTMLFSIISLKTGTESI